MDTKNNTIGIYIHIPFCDKKCSYCDFCSYKSNQEQRDLYIKLLCSEIELYKDLLSNYKVESIFFGGGTPSTLNSQQVDAIFKVLQSHVRLAAGCEISSEANPESLNQSFIDIMQKNGMNRLSLGVQSFHDTILEKIGRLHDRKKAIFAIENAKKSGIKNISIDLMYGLPEQTLAMHKESLETAVSLDLQHISSYNLIVEEGTKLIRQLHAGTTWIPDEELQLEMYHISQEILNKANFKQYEISNYALPGFECKHNMRYWERGNYIGFGQVAHSYLKMQTGNIRFSNPRTIKQYRDNIIASNIFPNKKIQDQSEEKFEAIMLGLRMTDGMNFNNFNKEFSTNFLLEYDSIINKYLENGLLKINYPFVKLSKKGIELQNQILLDFM